MQLATCTVVPTSVRSTIDWRHHTNTYVVGKVGNKASVGEEMYVLGGADDGQPNCAHLDMYLGLTAACVLADLRIFRSIDSTFPQATLVDCKNRPCT